MYWIWANQRASEEEARIEGVPAVVAQLNLSFDDGVAVQTDVPLIEIVMDEDAQGPLTDNLIAPGARGLVMSSRLRTLLQNLGVSNLQSFPCVILNTVDGTRNDDYQLVNIVGRIACVDAAGSDLEMHPRTGELEFVNSLALDEKKAAGHLMFRLAEHTQIIVVDETIVGACETEGITGVRFYEPADFSM
jgi:hypothetical protein